MEWTNRDTNASAPAPVPQQIPPSPEPTAPSTNHGGKKKRNSSIEDIWTKVTKIGFLVLLFSGTILIVALLWYLVLSDKNNESKYIDNSKLQAVFLNGGQVYFGKLTSLNNSYARLANIYYLRVNQQVQPGQNTSANDVSLVKLGCELHGPVDEMLINRDQIVFWENLKSDGQVTKAVAEYVKQNPNGQVCENANNSTNSNSNNNQSNAPTPSNPEPTDETNEANQ